MKDIFITQTANWGFEVAYAYSKKKPVLIVSTEEIGVEILPEQAASDIIRTEDIDQIDTISMN